MPTRRPDGLLPLTRRRALALAGLGAAGGLLAGCGRGEWNGTDVTGASPDLRFRMTRADDGKAVSEKDYRGKVVLLYFGYTFCPDVCPLTLANIASVLRALGPEADKVRVLFVTVDPGRDSLEVMRDYVALFAPQIDGLRGTPDQITAFARRYRVVHSVSPETADHPYEVSHGSAVYAFDPSGAARILYASLASAAADIDGITDDLRRLIAGA